MRDLALPGATMTPEWLDGCTAAVAAGAGTSALMAACTPPPGTLHASASCVVNAQCAGYCQSVAFCQDFVPLGGACITGLFGHMVVVPCAGGASCVPGPNSPLQATGNCQVVTPTPPPGFDGGPACDDDAGADSGLGCPYSYACSNGACIGVGTAGMSCLLNDDCASPLVCVALSRGNEFGVCGTQEVPTDGGGGACLLDAGCPAGQHCDENAQCVVGADAGTPCFSLLDCLPGAMCSSDGGSDGGSDQTCTAQPVFGPCDGGLGPGTCSTGCDAFGTCLDPSDPLLSVFVWFGQACVANGITYSCPSVIDCPASGVCPDLAPIGADCTSDTVGCGPFALCRNGTCQLTSAPYPSP
jgi:hypothetical protein